MNPVTFSTLACPGWSIAAVIQKAREFGYDGVEWRGGPQGHVNPDLSSGEKASLIQMSADARLSVLAVTAYTSFVSDSAAERHVNIDTARRYIDLASELGARFVRIFLGELPRGQTPHNTMYDRIASSIREAAEPARGMGVALAIEPHDDFARAAAISPVLDRMDDSLPLRVIWDIGNAHAAGEDPEEGFSLLKEHLAYVHVKDGTGRGADWRLCSLGHGEVALGKTLKLLLSAGYTGAFSVEWEYVWHPELPPPEMELPAARKVVSSALAAIRSPDRLTSR